MNFYCPKHGAFVINATVTKNPTCPYVLFRVATHDVPCGWRLIPVYPKTEVPGEVKQ